MKKHFKLAALLFVAATLVASCSKGGESAPTDNTSEVSFSASISAMPSKATDTSFEAGDEIAVSAYSEDGSTYQSGVKYTYNNGLFTSSTPISYESGSETLSFRAIYPYISINANESTMYSVYTDQNIGSNYTLSDLMLGSSGDTSSSTPQLTFKHLLNKFVVNITSEGVDMTDVSVSLYAATTVTYNLSSLSYTPSSTINTINMAEDGVLNYKAIVVPQTISANSPIGTITVDGENYDFYVNDTFDLVAGCKYTINATVKKEDEVVIVEVDFDSSSITDWEEGTLPEPVTEVTLALADFADLTSYPKVPTWVITDVEAEGGSNLADGGDFEDLQNILNLAYNDGYEVEVVFKNLTSLDAKSFSQCSITSISLPEALSIGESAFYMCSSLVEVSAPKATNIDEYAFNESSVSTLYLPLVETSGNYAFSKCPSLITIDLPSLTSIGNYTFYNSTYLESVSLPQLSFFGDSNFMSCSSLKNLTLATECEITNMPNYAISADIAPNVTLTTGSLNTNYVADNVLTFGSYSITFKEIIVL